MVVSEAKKNEADGGVGEAEVKPVEKVPVSGEGSVPVEKVETPKPKSEERGSEVKVTSVSAPMVQAVQVPDVLPLLPVRGSVGFPGAVMPLTIGRPKSKKLLDDALPPDRLLYRLFHSEGVATDRARALSYGCRCSRARLVGILEGFPQDDLDHMAVDGDIVMTCEFCNFDFRFPRQEVRGRSAPAC